MSAATGSEKRCPRCGRPLLEAIDLCSSCIAESLQPDEAAPARDRAEEPEPAGDRRRGEP